MGDSKSKKKTETKKDTSSPTLREQFNLKGGTKDHHKTTQLINAICDKIGLE